AHTQTWGSISTKFLTQCYKDGQPEDRYGPINPSVDENFNVLSNIFNEVLSIFPDTLIHLGGRDVTFDCWQSNPDIQEFMKTQSLGDSYNALENYYFSKLMENVLGTNSSEWTVSPVVWQDVFNNGFRGEAPIVIHLHQPEWKSTLEEATKAGYRVIFSSCWRLSEMTLEDDWKKFYECDFTSFEGTEDQLALLIGGEALLWGINVDDANMFPETWPLAATVAERLWSQDPPETEEFGQELDELRCRMVRRGWNAQAIVGPGFCPQ
uniref:beta-N-acetylhexosaminidase n=1 Tax=Trichobilharzia regenti TaxID=157069 RepID=A0AA85JBC9_TRIRE